MQMTDIDRVALALFDLAQGQNAFDRLSTCKTEQQTVADETGRLQAASNNLEREIIALDEQRASVSKLIDAAFPPEAKQAADKVFTDRFSGYFAGTQKLLEAQIIEARNLEIQTVTNLANAQQIELEQIAALKGR
jgi:hypothetical protein